VEGVDVVEGVSGEADEEERGEGSAEPGRAGHKQERGGEDFGGDDGDGDGPDEAVGDEVREVGDEISERVELRARREQKHRGEPEAAEERECLEPATHKSRGVKGETGKRVRGKG
jgi:hypothetical protein